MDHDNITEVFRSYIREAGSIDVAEAEFKKAIGEDSDLHQLYRDWCHEVGSSERQGFLDFCDEFMEDQDSRWDALDNEYDW